MFQVESRARCRRFREIHPANFTTLFVRSQLYALAPSWKNDAIPICGRRQGREQVTYAHPSLEPVLRQNAGRASFFQGAIVEMAMIAANFSGGEAEDLRRAMGFKRSEESMHEIEQIAAAE